MDFIITRSLWWRQIHLRQTPVIVVRTSISNSLLLTIQRATHRTVDTGNYSPVSQLRISLKSGIYLQYKNNKKQLVSHQSVARAKVFRDRNH